MNNKVFFGILGLIVVAFIGVFIAMNNGSSETPEELSESGYYPYTDKEPNELNGATINLLDNEDYQDNKTPEEVDQMIKNGDEILLYLWSPLCSHCQNSTPLLQDAIDETGANLVQLNILEYPEASQKYQVEGTPTSIYFKDGEELDRIPGDPQSVEGYVSFIEKYAEGE